MSFNRPIVFWITLLLVLVSAVALLREVLLPFVAGMVLAYLLNPIAQRMERWGMIRLIATLVIIALALAIISALIILIVPVIVRELSYFIESFPLYVRQLRALASDPARPWLGKLVGQGSPRLSARSASSRASRRAGSALSCDRYGRADGR
jgi:predicted PurR-regulated permease PerM